MRTTTVLFFFNDTATTEIYTLSLHDALPISNWLRFPQSGLRFPVSHLPPGAISGGHLTQKLEFIQARSEEHTSELQSRQYLVCRLLLEKNKNAMSIILLYTTMLTALTSLLIL